MPKRRAKPTYNTSVFINCPFDPEYRPLFRALVFGIEYCGFAARCALEIDDAGETRAERLIRLIRESRFGVHDISRTELDEKLGLPRFNTPYELGLFVGFKVGGDRTQGRKSLLVLDREQYRYQAFLSDIAGQDIASHDLEPSTLIQRVRNWLQGKTNCDLAGGEYVRDRFAQFQTEMPDLLAVLNKTPDDLNNYHDFHRLVCDWIEANEPAA